MNHWLPIIRQTSDNLASVYFETQRYFTMSIYFRQARKIEFRSLTDLSQIIYNFSTGYTDPGALCAESTSTLLVVNQSNGPSDAYWLDCSEDEPTLTGKKITIDFPAKVWDISFLSNERKPLLLAIQYGRLHAYSALTNKLEWKSEVGGNSVTTYCHDYVMVCAHLRHYICMFSLPDGKKLGYLMRDGDQGLGKLKHVRWCNMTSSLIVVHDVDEEIHISTIQFK